MVILMLLISLVTTVMRMKKKLERNRKSELSVTYSEIEHVNKIPPGAIDTESNMAYTSTQ